MQKVGPHGVELGFRDDVRVGAPLIIVTQVIGALWIWL
jgi:hypothetical protein